MPIKDSLPQSAEHFDAVHRGSELDSQHATTSRRRSMPKDRAGAAALRHRVVRGSSFLYPEQACGIAA
jgi:hypothetical protein